METIDIITILAIILSPIIAIVVGYILHRTSFKKEKRLNALYDLISFRDKLSHERFLSALNALILLYNDKLLKTLLFELRKTYENQEKAEVKMIKVIKRVCELEKFGEVSENDIENLFKAN